MLRPALVLVLIAGAVAASFAGVPALLQESAGETLTSASTDDEPALQAWAVEWSGFIRAGPADMLAHQQETEPLVAPVASMGFNVEVPPGSTALEFALTWPKGTPMHLMAHGPHEAGMPTYMGGWPDSGEACIRVPADEVEAGTWKVMAHSDRTATDLEFVISVRSAGAAPPEVLDGLHGHSAMDQMNMPMRAPETCGA